MFIVFCPPSFMKKKIHPYTLYSDQKGNIYDHPHLLMVCRRGNDFVLPKPDELIELPHESNLFFLPGRRAVGYNPDSGRIEALEELAVSAFVAPGYTLCSLAAFIKDKGAPVLPLFAYAPVGYFNGKLYVCAKKVDEDKRQVFKNIPIKKITNSAHKLLNKYPNNRLVAHLSKCALTYSCPAAKNFALGRFEAPIPTSTSCNARCIGCISLQPEESNIPATQERIKFTPTPKEILEVMEIHASREKRPIFSFGQGCEGEPLTQWKIIVEAVKLYRSNGGIGTININTNGSITEAIEPLAKAGVTSLRISLNSATNELYAKYYRPKGYELEDVINSILIAKKMGLFISINLLFFPGVTDTETELDSLMGLIEKTNIDFIQLRNLNIDPDLYLSLIDSPSPSMGLSNFKKRLKKNFPWLKFGYFNPFVEK